MYRSWALFCETTVQSQKRTKLARGKWKAKVEEGNDWWEEVERKSSLGGYRMKFGLELTLGAQGQEPVRYQFRHSRSVC